MKKFVVLVLWFLFSFGTAWADVVNVNTASMEELSTSLVGVGEKRAAAIIEYREKNGPFQSIEGLLEVNGIGEVILEKNRDRITLGPS